MNARAASGVTAEGVTQVEDAPQADALDALGLPDVPGRPVAARLESAQRVLDEHSCRIPEVRCRACGQTGPCRPRKRALAVFEEHGRLPRHRPVRGGSETAGMGETGGREGTVPHPVSARETRAAGGHPSRSWENGRGEGKVMHE